MDDFNLMISDLESRLPSKIECIETDFSLNANIKLLIKREDLIDRYISGNKYRKLKYNIKYAIENKFDTLVTFGGAFSNHIFATSAFAQKTGLQSIGVIRGERTEPLNETLDFAEKSGMKLVFVSREEYKTKNDLKKWQIHFPNSWIIPEGGTNQLAIKGCEELAMEINLVKPDYVMIAAGTGGTATGILSKLNPKTKLLVIPVLKGGFMKNEIDHLIIENKLDIKCKWDVLEDFHEGGYAKNSVQLTEFIDNFESQTGIKTEYVYTGKMMFAIKKLCLQSYFPFNSSVMAIHTGGLRPW